MPFNCDGFPKSVNSSVSDKWPRWLVLVLFCSSPMAALAGGDEAAASRFQLTVLSLRAEDLALRSDFASIALNQLAETFMAEADLARREARDAESPGKLLGWSRAVDRYADDLLRLVDELEEGMPVEVSADQNSAVTLTVANRAIILTHPRSTQQAEFDQRVLAEFCSRNVCARLTKIDVEDEPIPVSATRVTPDWAFSLEGPVCSHRDVEVRFSSTADLARIRQICGQFFQELLTLATELAWQQRHGVRLDGGRWSIRPTTLRPEHLVTLNAAGDSVLVAIPLIYSSELLQRDIAPWLQECLDGARFTPLRLDGARYGWR